MGEAEVCIKNRFRSVQATISVLEGANRNLLGISEIKSLNLLAVVNSINRDSFDVFSAFPRVFEGLGTMPGEFKIQLKKGTEPYCLMTPRNIAAGLREKVKDEIDKMLLMKVIEPVEIPTEWCSGLTIAPKPNGAIRLCVDLTRLNKGVKREMYPLPRVSDMLSRLSEGTIFSKMDANSGFWQVKLSEESKLFTTFISPWGRYCFRRMPFGISSAPEFYQRTMEKILHGLEGVICLMDDVLVYGKDTAQHWSRLKRVLEKISAAGVTLKKSKCEFGCSSVKFLGHIISSEGIKADPEKVKAIQEMASPTNKREVRRFMGMVNYLSKFSSKLTELSVPLFDVMGQKSTWYWGINQQAAFEGIKNELSRAPVLCSFDLKKNHRVSADASKAAIGAVLLQSAEGGSWQPIEYASRKMTEAEQRYAMIEKESLAITWACEKFDFYLMGRAFQIETDHKPLVSLLGEKDLSQLPLRVQRFKLRMMRFDYEIFHTPGKDMYLADALSRPLGEGCPDEAILNSIEVEKFVDQVINSELCEQRKTELLESLGRDAVSAECLHCIRHGWPRGGGTLSGELRRLYSCRDMLTERQGIIFCNSRVYIPEELRATYLERAHEGHQGVVKCQRRSRQLFWWPGVSSSIKQFIAKCRTCIESGAIKDQPSIGINLPDEPWSEVGTDVLTFRGDLYLVVVDYYSRWIEAVPIETQTAKCVIDVLKEVFSRLGVPNRVRSDNGPCFACAEFSQFAASWGFIHATSSPLYPQSNGMAERAVGTVKGLWNSGGDRAGALLAYRSTPLGSGYSPAELLFGRPVATPLGNVGSKFVDYREFEGSELSNKYDAKLRWDKKHRAKLLPVLSIGDRVWVKTPKKPGREGVVSRLDPLPDSFWIDMGSQCVRRNRKHLFLLNRGNDDMSDLSDNNDEGEFTQSGVSFGLPPNASHDEIPADAANACIPVSVASSSLEGAARVLSSQGNGQHVPENVPTRTASGRIVKPLRDKEFIYF